MMRFWRRLEQAVAEHGQAATVQVAEVRGSAPREPGAAVVLRPDGAFWGTIGGGALEWEAIAAARAMLQQGRGPAQRRDWPLGPDLGQCCGGVVVTLTETFDRSDLPELAALAELEQAGAFASTAVIRADGRVVRAKHAPARALPAGAWLETHGDAAFSVALFGAGHVGRALVLALAPLPVTVDWIDSRPEAFPAAIPQNAVPRVHPDPTACVAAMAAGTALLVMTHSHPLDLAIVGAALARPDLGPVGLIGSGTKRARFLSRLRDAGLGEAAERRLVCPIGLPGIGDKDPAVIAASVAAQVLLWREALRNEAGPAASDRVQGVDDDATAGRKALGSGHRANPPGRVRIGRGRRAGGRT